MEYAVLFRRELAITGSEETDNHKGTYALDYGSYRDIPRMNYAPFTAMVMAIHPTYNTLYLQSMEKIILPKRQDNAYMQTYACCTLSHFRELSPYIRVGAVLPQGTFLGYDGSKGLVDDHGVPITNQDHIHARFGYGIFRSKVPDDMLYPLANGNYAIAVSGGLLHHYDAFFLPNNTVISTAQSNPAAKYPWVLYPAASNYQMLYEQEKEKTDTIKRIIATWK